MGSVPCTRNNKRRRATRRLVSSEDRTLRTSSLQTPHGNMVHVYLAVSRPMVSPRGCAVRNQWLGSRRASRVYKHACFRKSSVPVLEISIHSNSCSMLGATSEDLSNPSTAFVTFAFAITCNHAEARLTSRQSSYPALLMSYTIFVIQGCVQPTLCRCVLTRDESRDYQLRGHSTPSDLLRPWFTYASYPQVCVRGVSLVTCTSEVPNT